MDLYRRREAAQNFSANVGADLPPDVVDHWRSQITDGHVDPGDAAALSDLLRQATRRLLSYMQEKADAPVTEADVHRKYGPVLVASDPLNAAEVAILIETIDVRLDLDFARPLLALAPDEASYRLSRLKEWMGRIYNHDVIVTPVLAEFLARPGDFEAMLAHLDTLAGETGRGGFDAADPLQRDLEYQKHSHEYHRLYGTNRKLPYVNEPPSALYRKFVELPVLDHNHRDEPRLDYHLLEIRRVAYEAAGFLRFLRRFRAGTSRPIVVIGNNRYGRQWIVEPLEQFLRDGFTLRYDGVPSHMSTRLSVASARNFEQSADNTGPWTSDAFPAEFVREMDRDMPHIVVADAKSTHRFEGSMMLSRAAKTYANWLAAFNYVRAGGRVEAYRDESCLPPDHLERLVHWYEFVRVRRQLELWVTPGPTYSVGLWAPQTTETAHLGEIPVALRPPELDTDRPQFVLANPLVYDDTALPEDLRGTAPYYLDGPEKYVKEEIVFGFGPYGFQPAVKGTMTAAFVAAAQRTIAEEVTSLTADDA